ncbi:hypothetical protein Cgig2_004231 [Carnegiea gigantea]|uniref:Uncharacterized protein n=1 Tax=Carnegiea gigantea TaxID=171969 RepID=A0A9Q1QBW2_9CARY|nr:hypothetical protein Cgig2_004231 [Carnegiea gigantea]
MVQDRTGPKTGTDRTGPRPFGPVLGPVLFCFRSSVRSGLHFFGLLEFLFSLFPLALSLSLSLSLSFFLSLSSLTLYSLPLHLSVFSCYCSPLNTPNRSNSLCSLVCANTGRRPAASGATFQLVEPGGPTPDRSGPWSKVCQIFDPRSSRSGPVRSWSDEHPYLELEADDRGRTIEVEPLLYKFFMKFYI